MKKKKRTDFKLKREKFTNKSIPEKFYTKEDVFVSRLASILMVPKSRVKGIFSQRAITTIRLNSLIGRTSETKELLERKGYMLEEVPWAKDVYFVNNKDKSEVSQTEEYREGRYYIQNLSSILATLVLDPKEEEKILDMCAAPGSKTTHIAQITNNKANILANDSDISRVSAMEDVLEQFGAKNVKSTYSDAGDFGKKYPVSFDKVLLDAPCSGEGMVYFQGPKPLRYWNIDKIKRCMFSQRELIVSAFKTLKHGKYMIYSTCTLEPEENEGVVTYLLNMFPNARLEKIDLINGKEFDEYREYIKPGIKKWSGNIYHPTVKNSLRVIPNKKMMGFYIAKIVKE
ncbi:RsmB/NOP family class I SAM-dependent RNA methyltransferase [Candidatus Microgenomates bacterium]|nr:RsmB/NOP family class I SAM-dependent RNA methyltransferase [Candidatus Microgenomates bacterium]